MRLSQMSKKEVVALLSAMIEMVHAPVAEGETRRPMGVFAGVDEFGVEIPAEVVENARENLQGLAAHDMVKNRWIVSVSRNRRRKRA